MTMQDNPLVLGGDNPSMSGEYVNDAQYIENPPAPEITPTPNQPVTPEEPNDYIRLSRKDLQREIDRLRVDDPDFAQVYNRDIGNKAASRYKPQLTLLQQQNEALALALRKENYSKLTEDEVNTRFRNDPAFAEDYAKVSHAPTPNVQPTVNQQQIMAEIGMNLSNLDSLAQSMLTAEQYREITNNVTSGKYDVADDGSALDAFNWRDGVERMRNDITRLARGNTSSQPSTNNAPTAQPQQQQRPNNPASRVDNSTPDLSPSGGRGQGRQSFTMQQVREMSWEEQMRRWPNDGDIDRAIESGEITLNI